MSKEKNTIISKEELGKRLRECREEKGVTQQAIADFCELTKNHISLIERGGTNCSAQALIGYAKLLKVSLDTLTGLKPKEQETLYELQLKLSEAPITELTDTLSKIQKELSAQKAILPELFDQLSQMDSQKQKKVLDILKLLQE